MKVIIIFTRPLGVGAVTFTREDIRFPISGRALIILYWNSSLVQSPDVKYQHQHRDFFRGERVH